LREVLARQTRCIRGSLEEVYAVHERLVGIDPTFAPFVARCEAANVPVTIVSSGIAPLIEMRLSAIGLGRLPVIAADVDVHPVSWTMRFRDASANGTDKAAHVRALQSQGTRGAFAGDGISDFGAAIAADDRYAKRGRALADFLQDRRIGYGSFTTFAEIPIPS